MVLNPGAYLEWLFYRSQDKQDLADYTESTINQSVLRYIRCLLCHLLIPETAKSKEFTKRNRDP
jgi:hypothetical protein